MTRLFMGAGALCALFAAQIGLASAGPTDINDSDMGFIAVNGASNGSAPLNNYLLGNCGLDDCAAGEVRDFFAFTIPTLDGSVTSLTLQIPTGLTALLQSSTLTAAFSALTTTSSFAAIGAGTAYGSFTYDASMANSTETITLNAAAIADVEADQGGTFLIGGQVTSATDFDAAAPDQAVFVHGGSSPVVLEITTDGSGSSVPEPASLALLCTGILGLRVARRAQV
jgi:hypothetical protein